MYQSACADNVFLNALMKFSCKFHSEPEQQQYTTVLDDNSIIKRIFIDKQSLKKGFVQVSSNTDRLI